MAYCKRQSLGFSADTIQLAEKSKRKLWQRWIKACLFIQGVDLFALFKDSHHALGELINRRLSLAVESGTRQLPKERHYHMNALCRHSVDLKMPQTRQDRWQRRLAQVLKVFSIYLYVKMLLICIFHYTLLKYSIKHRRGNPLWGFETAQRMAQLLGNPLQSLRDSALLIYTGPPGYLFFFVALLPAYYRRHPIDNAPLRFLLNPRHELRKIDANIRFKLAKLRASFEIYRWQQCCKFLPQNPSHLTLGVPVASSSSVVREGWQDQQLYQHTYRREEHFCASVQRLLRHLSSSRAEVMSFRPRNFSPEYYVEMSALIQPTVWGSTLLYAGCIAVFSLTIWIHPYMTRCPSMNCSIHQVFNLTELIVFLELLVTMLIALTVSSLNLVQISLISTNQLNLIEFINAELGACQSILVDYNLAQSNERKRLAATKGDKLNETGSRAAAIQAPSQDRLDEYMLRTLIKLLVCDDELARNSRSLSMEVLNPFYYALGIIFIFVMNGQFRFPETYFIRNFVLVVSWLNVNMIAISCAYINSRVLDFKRRLWSILALSYEAHQDCYNEWLSERQHQLKLMSARNFIPSNKLPPVQRTIRDKQKLKSCSFIIDLWIKFIHASVMNRERHCRLFFVEFSYQGLIEANFFAIFVWSFSAQD